MNKAVKTSIKKLPSFRNENEERKFWATHELSDVFNLTHGADVTFPNLKPSTKTITIRVSESLLFALKGIARKKDVPYQSLAKVYLDEKIREEHYAGVRE